MVSPVNANHSRLARLISEKLTANGHPPLDTLVPTLRRQGLSWRQCSAEVAKRSGEFCSDNNLQRWFSTAEAKA